MTKNAYIHIPFCKLKCNYCSFVSYESTDYMTEYLNALDKEIKNVYKGENLNTLYIGGGTPSLCDYKQISRIVERFSFADRPEITMECNPDDVSFDYLKELREVGINRLSVGVQTFDDKILNIIGRRHDSSCAIRVVSMAQKAGFDNISIDFIYGLPHQSLKGFELDLIKSLTLDTQHVSFYGLKIDDGCKFAKNMPDNLPDSDLQADMYELACEVLKNAGFEHYEISNFAKKGFYSRHNLNYWDNNTYYGFGAAASGYDGFNRYTNQTCLSKYIENPFEKIETVEVSDTQKLEEEIFLGFRKGEGIDVYKIKEKYGFDFEKEYEEVLEKFRSFIVKTEKGYRFNDRGFMISNEILTEFIQ